jgi:NADH-quinone oxidoreductase subunit L
VVNSDQLHIVFVPLLPLFGFLLIALSGKRMKPMIAAFISSSSVLVSFLVAVIVFRHATYGGSGEGISVTVFDWIRAGNFSVRFGLLADPLSCLFMLIITGVGFLIHLYSIGYMHGDEGFNRFFSYLNLFVFFMLLLVMGDNYLVMFVGWEGVGLCSYLLIGFWFKNQDYNSAANKAFIMNRIGDLGMLIGIILIFMHTGSVTYKEVFSAIPGISTETITIIAVLLFVGAMGKSAQIPLYTWLPDAMAGPTPVSALIHAATMVTAGIYMVARNSAIYSLSPFALELVAWIGILTALLAATIAVAQNDIKKILAYSTVSQLGLMFLALGLGSYTTGIFHVATHAFFKALLFLGAGSVIHALGGEQDIRNMGGLRKYLPVTFLTILVGVLAISGIPPFAGFFSKDEILAVAFEHNKVLWALALITSLLTAYYMFRFFFLIFFGPVRASKHAMDHIHESPLTITIPLATLAILSVIGGFMGVPEALGGSHWLKEFLAPVFTPVSGEHELSHATEYALMGAVVGLTLVVIFIAYNSYVSKKNVPAADENVTGLQRTLANKYYVDEHYQLLVVKPLYWLSRQFDSLVERAGIDRIVNSFGNITVAGSRGARYLQDGGIGFYIFVMVISIVLILTFSVTW